MFRDDLDQLLIAQILPRHVFPVYGLIRADSILRSECRAVQQLPQVSCRERLLHIVAAVKLQALLSQDTLDLTTLTSGRLLVNDHPVCSLHACHRQLGTLLLLRTTFLRETNRSRDLHF